MSFDLNRLIRPNILRLSPYSSARDEFKGEAAVFLDANENPFGSLNRYPDPYQQALKQKLASIKGTDTDQIFIGNGSDEVIDLLIRIFCEPGKDEILICPPTYGMYEVCAQINNVGVRAVPLTEDFQLNLPKVLETLKSETVKIIFLCSPNNPTANAIEGIEEILNHFNGLVVVDEAYIDFSSRPSFLQKINEYPQLVVSQTFSKAWGLAAARVGLAFAQPSIIEWMNKVKPPYNISSLNQKAALAALENAEQTQEQIQILIAERKKLMDALQKMKAVKKVYPSEANFILIAMDNAQQVYTNLVNQNIIIRDRTKVIKDGLRITVGSPEENQLLLTTLAKIA